MNKITAYTDGSAVLKYPFKGGSGIYIKTQTKSFKIRKGWCNTKTGRCELHAVIICLRSIKNKKAKVTIYSDSMYVVNTCNEWIQKWERDFYYDKKNVDLLKQLIFELRQFERWPTLNHIKGHQDVSCEHTLGNSIADELANYKTQTIWEVDVPFDDLFVWEEEDFKNIDGKMFWKEEII